MGVRGILFLQLPHALILYIRIYEPTFKASTFQSAELTFFPPCREAAAKVVQIISSSMKLCLQMSNFFLVILISVSHLPVLISEFTKISMVENSFRNKCKMFLHNRGNLSKMN